MSDGVKVSQEDIDAVKKTLDQFKGKPLAIRMEKSIEASMRTFFLQQVLRRARRHRRTGATEQGYDVRRLQPRSSEAAAYQLASTTAWRAYAITGTVERAGPRGRVEADPYIDEVRAAFEPRAVGFIEEQVARLA